MNRLINSKSPYLLQHAYNPVDWFPWSEEALLKAKSENKPILVSIGYSACHWCHVMEKESFEDKETADLMNNNFVCIKIDREERPDLDNIYMDAVQAMGLQGGWPLNVFLMPDQKPFYGGTYFPNPQWKSLLQNIADAYTKNFDQLAESAESFALSLQASEFEKYGLSHDVLNLSKSELSQIVGQLVSQFDEEWGGMNRKPKFPMPSIWAFVMEVALLQNDQILSNKVFFTLEKIGMGGIYDHLRGGFARYSVDGEWFAPHFEKMLYDNGQLMELYAKAYALTRNDFFKEKSDETISWLQHEMSEEKGGFYAAQDADSEGVEGKFYTWTYDELESIVGDDLSWFAKLYNVKFAGNWEEGVNILFQTDSYENLAEEEGLTRSAYVKRLQKVKSNLLAIRNMRVFPGLDDKVLSGWNGLMISGLVKAHLFTGNESAMTMAVSCGEFIRNKMYLDGKLFRSYKNGEAYTPAFLEDYAAVIRAFIDLYQITYDLSWVQFAKKLTEDALKGFYDEKDGFFFFNNPSSEKLIANKKELFDNVIPSSNSIMAKNLQDLSLMYYDDIYAELSKKMLSSIKPLILKDPGFLSNWASHYLNSLVPKAEVAIVGKGAIAKARELQSAVLANCVIAASEEMNDQLPLLVGKKADANGNALIYVCYNKACQKPVSDISEAISQMPHL
ncbi:thioredoxin domain-containing protein [Arthrospiribacter ruber]|uniref:Thioredoxin domain-containing protein n=1 Tax=Arthrospiribacter ruber TaxID=2487934 RepID=A0A951MDD6_9BACT|nr:thioredoxin domain-containing protein [Arthrospiribacter ruber]MBW3468447.1 thioredoxin domain-containing protein [Arthrospiribacter ruber]